MNSRNPGIGGGRRVGEFSYVDSSSAVAPRRKSAAIVIIIIIVVLVLVGIALLIYFLVRRARAASGSGGGGSGGGSTNDDNVPPTTGPDCTSSSQCPASTPVCSTAGVCVQCQGAEGCSGSATCSGTACCTSETPSITNVSSSVSSNSSFTVTYTYSQKAPTSPSSTAVQVEVSLQTPAGNVLATILRQATGSVTLTETDLNLPNQHLFPGVEYRVKIRIKYNCGGTSNLFTSQTSATNFTMGGCVDTAVPITQGPANTGGIGAYGGFTGMSIRLFSYGQPIIIGTIISPTSGIHPNLAEIYYGAINSENLNIPPDPETPGFMSQWARVPYPGEIGSTNYVRIFRVNPGFCISPLSIEYTFLRTY